MAEEKKKWWQKIDVMDILIAGAVIPYLKDMAEKVVKTLGKKAESVLGLDFETAKNETIDDFYFLAAQANLKDDEITKVYNFKHWLKEHDKDQLEPKGPDEETAFILYVAKMVKTFERENKEVAGVKGNNQRQESTFKVEKGVILATRFFKNLLSKANNEEMRHFLENEKVFALIVKPKESSPFLKEAKNFFSNLAPTDDQMTELEKKFEESKMNKKNRRTS